MSIKIFNKIMIGATGLFSLAMMSTSQAMPILFSNITMEVHSTSNIRVNGGDNATSLLTRFDSGSLICTVTLAEFTNVGGKQNCGTGSNDDLATLYTIDYFLNSGTADFQLGADWGLGGIIIGTDGGDILRTDDIWWANNWNNSDVIDFSVSSAGYGTFQLLGFEACCSGRNSLRVSVDNKQTFSAVVTTVPEPVTIALLGLGFMGLAMVRKKRK